MPEGNRKTPITLKLEYSEQTSTLVEGFPIHTVFVTADKFLELPLDANVRLPSDKSIPYKEMIKTLKSSPEKFLLQNSGISVIAGKATFKKDKTVELVFPPDTGIVNGGHTQKALLDSKAERDVSRATVKIEILEKLFDPKELAEIAASRNTASNVKPYSTAEKKGLFGPIKHEKEDKFEKHIVWYENRVVPNGRGFSAIDLIAMLNLFSVFDYQSSINPDKSEQPNKSATSKGSVFSDWEAGEMESLKFVYPLVNDIISLMEHIESTFDKNIGRGFTTLGVIKNVIKFDRTTLFLGKKVRFELPKQFMYPVLAAFRANVHWDETNKKVGWFEKPELLFDKCKAKLFEDLSRTYKTTYHNEINRTSKDSNLWRILYLNVASALDKTRVWKEYGVVP
jgi:hypothetical protein